MKTRTLNILMVVSLAVLALSLIFGFWAGKSEFEEKAALKERVTHIETHKATELIRIKDSLVTNIKDSVRVITVTVYDTVTVPILGHHTHTKTDVEEMVEVVVYTNYPENSIEVMSLDHMLNHLQNGKRDVNVPFFRKTSYNQDSFVRYYNEINSKIAVSIRDSIRVYTGKDIELRRSYDKPQPVVDVYMVSSIRDTP